MQRYNSSRRLFDTDDLNSDLPGESVFYISIGESGEVSDVWESDCSTDTEQLIERIERDVYPSLVVIGGRIMTVKGEEEEMVAGPSTSQRKKNTTPKLGPGYFDEKLSYAAPKKESTLHRNQLCKAIIPVADSPMSPPPHARGPSMETPINLVATSIFRASYHIQNTGPYQHVSTTLYTGCLICGSTADAIKREKVDCYMRNSTSRDEPEQVTRLRREAYENSLNAVSFLFLVGVFEENSDSYSG